MISEWVSDTERDRVDCSNPQMVGNWESFMTL